MAARSTDAGALSVRSPHSGDLLEELPLDGDAELERALASASALASSGRGLARELRARALRGAGRLLAERADAFALRIAREGGKPLLDARVEVARAAGGLEYLAGEVARLAGEEVPMDLGGATDGRLAFTTLEPIGVVVAISAFNHPLNLIVHQVGAAIAAGCPVIVKPALETPLSCRALVALLEEAGLPPGWGQVLLCEDARAERLATDPRVAYLSFIGSARVGWHLRSRVAPGTRVGLEHGGSAPVLVDEGADVERAVTLVAKGGFYHAGQVCVSVQRVLAHASLAGSFAEALAAAAAKLRVGDPEDPETQVGPLIRARELPRVEAWLSEARDRGAAVLAGGDRRGRQTLAPAVLTGVPEDVRVWRDEVFGPVVSVASFEDLDDAVARANALPWAFQAAIFTRDVGRALRAARGLAASAVLVNDHTAFRADWMPFGGRRESGLGLAGLRLGVRDLCAPKLIVLSG